MLWHPSVRRCILQMTHFGLLMGVAVWTILIVRGAQSLRNNPFKDSYLVHFGPLKLTHISKHPIEGGFTAGFSLETGLVWYVLFWLVIGCLLGLGVVWYGLKTRE
jgi:uncharacterized membrane protein